MSQPNSHAPNGPTSPSLGGTHQPSDDHGHGHNNADHVPHVTPVSHYFGVFAALLMFTAITVGVSYVDFGPWNLVIAMVVATTKACLVAAIFMHLLYDLRFHTIVFSFSLIFLAIFITFTSFDTFARGRAELVEGLRPTHSTDPFAKNMIPHSMYEPRTPHYEATLEAKERAGEEEKPPIGQHKIELPENKDHK